MNQINSRGALPRGVGLGIDVGGSDFGGGIQPEPPDWIPTVSLPQLGEQRISAYAPAG